MLCNPFQASVGVAPTIEDGHGEGFEEAEAKPPRTGLVSVFLWLSVLHSLIPHIVGIDDVGFQSGHSVASGR
jgi:hypothetical protein